VLLLALVVVCVSAGTALAALGGLPADGSHVNDDAAAGIDKTRNVSGEDPANADVVGGALTAGGLAVPWSIFRQATAGADQLFVRAFAGGAWSTKGTGTVGGKSSASPTFSGSLNFDQAEDGEAPAIDFAGAGRTVPWATWYENATAFAGASQIFASRFDNSGDANQGKWIFAGQSRGVGTGTVAVPSLNIHTDQNAENPSVAGGSAVDPTKPGPWVTWQETGASAPGLGKNQIFVEKPIGPGSTSCVGIEPTSATPASPPLGGFCWQQVGVERLTADPSLNVDRTRDGVEPDIAFTGPNDSVPWVVWYETGTGTAGLHANELVFAAKGVAPGTATGTDDGGFAWDVVGNAGQGVLDASTGGGACGASATVEAACSLNSNSAVDAEDPRVAAGTMTPGAPTVPWVVWDEQVGGVHQIFVSRLLGGTRFAIANNGAPVSTGTTDATRADITFSGNTPYVSWRQDIGGGVEQAFAGHFVNSANPTFVLDSSSTPLTPTLQADVREPISSTCIATPFDGDGATCQGGAIGTPFFLFTNGTSPRGLFADTYEVDTPTPGAPTGITTTSGILTGAQNPEGAPVSVSFQYGATTAYGQTTAPQPVAPGNTAVAFQAQLASLAPATTLHYRAVASSDFVTRFGPDETLTTAALTPPPPPPDRTPPGVKLKVTHTTLGKLISSGHIKLAIALSEAGSLRVTPTIHARVKHKTRVIGLGKTVTARFAAAGTRTLTLTLNRNGKARLRKLRSATITLSIQATDTAGNRTTKLISSTWKRP
jgi:hypothetical protein